MTSFFWDGLVEQSEPGTQTLRPDADTDAASWATAPLWSKIEEAVADATVVSASATGTSPAVVGTPAETAISTAGTSHVVNLPSGATGNLLLAVMSKGSEGTTPSVNALAGWSELLDEAIVLGLYVAWRVADGTEGATTTFTLSSATRGAWIVYEISGQSATIAPQVGTTATGSSTTPDPPSVAVTDGSKPVLSIACFGRAGEEADDDTWVTAAPSGFGGLLQKACGIAGSNLGGMISTAHLQETTATDNPGTFTIATGAWRAQTIVVHPAAAQTSVARVSLGGGSVPYADVAHAIKVVARASSGAGTLRAALYEGANNRSGDLESPALTSTLSEFTLPLTEASGAAITDYSDLEIRIWGYSATGVSLTVEVDQLYLSYPESAGAATYFGASSLTSTVAVTTAGVVTAMGASSSAYAFGIVTAGTRTRFGATASSYDFGFTTNGVRTRFGATASSYAFGFTTAGTRTRFGATATTLSLTAASVGKLTALGRTTLTETFTIGTDGTVEGPTVHFGAASMSLNVGITTAGTRTRFGATASSYAFGIVTAGRRTTFGATGLPIAVSRAVAGTRTTFGSTVTPIVFGVTTSGQVGAGISVELTFGATTNGTRTTFGAASSTYAVAITTAGHKYKSGAASMTLNVPISTAGSRATTGSASMVINFSASVDGTPPETLEEIVTGWLNGGARGHIQAGTSGRIEQLVGGGVE